MNTPERPTGTWKSFWRAINWVRWVFRPHATAPVEPVYSASCYDVE